MAPFTTNFELVPVVGDLNGVFNSVGCGLVEVCCCWSSFYIEIADILCKVEVELSIDAVAFCASFGKMLLVDYIGSLLSLWLTSLKEFCSILIFY